MSFCFAEDFCWWFIAAPDTLDIKDKTAFLATKNAGWVTTAQNWVDKECDHCSTSQILLFRPAPSLNVWEKAVVLW